MLPVSQFKQVYGQKELCDLGVELELIANNDPEKVNCSCFLTLSSGKLFELTSAVVEIIYLVLQVPKSANPLDLGRKKGKDGEERGKITHPVVINCLAFLFCLV